MTNAKSRYRTADVEVTGGLMRVGVWEPAAGDGAEAAAGDNGQAPTLVAVHGVTASHRCWPAVVQRLPGWRVIAPDLRGRGRSNHLPGPFGMATHADDIAAVMGALDVQDAVIAGHSMGGFVTAALHARHPDRIAAVVLVDGGVPLPLPAGKAAGMSAAEATAASLGPALQRLSMTFPDREAYRDFFRVHPAFAGAWTDAVADYVDYDLVDDPAGDNPVGERPLLRPATSPEAFAEDAADFSGGARWLLPALRGLPSGTVFLRAPRDLIDREPGLYPPDWLSRHLQDLPNLRLHEVPGTNHYTILFGEAGIDAVVGAITDARPSEHGGQAQRPPRTMGYDSA